MSTIALPRPEPKARPPQRTPKPKSLPNIPFATFEESPLVDTNDDRLDMERFDPTGHVERMKRLGASFFRDGDTLAVLQSWIGLTPEEIEEAHLLFQEVNCDPWKRAAVRGCVLGRAH